MVLIKLTQTVALVYGQIEVFIIIRTLEARHERHKAHIRSSSTVCARYAPFMEQSCPICL